MYLRIKALIYLQEEAFVRRFNVTGTCVGHKHYMVDISGKLDEIEKLIEAEHYFTINRARQYGKTTTLLHLKQKLDTSENYICASISFEDAGVNAFDTEKTFCEMFLDKISKALRFSSAEKGYAKKWYCPKVSSFRTLGKHITDMCEDKKLVLMIDEVDKSSNNKLFLHFLGLLRAKYLARQGGMDYTFHSVILAGVTDIKNLKLKMINDGLHSTLKEEGRITNSPWNIAASFNVSMSFNEEEISTMLREYESDTKTGMDISAIAHEINKHTNGYPFLVSRICQSIDEELGKNWTADGVEKAVNIILEESSVLLDDMIKNLENFKSLYDFMYELLIVGETKTFNPGVPVISLANAFGFIKRVNGSKKLAVYNRIFENWMTHYFAAKDENVLKAKRAYGVIYQDVIKDGKFDMATCLTKFAEHYKEIFAKRDVEFFERHGRLLFLSFLKPLLNGQGNYYIESQFTDLRRMDVVVDFEGQQIIVELKLWKGNAHKEKAYEQLLGYMESKNATEGFMLTFDFRKQKTEEHKHEWVEICGRRIFHVVV